MSNHNPWPTSKTANITNAVGGSVISCQYNLTPQNVVNQIASMMDNKDDNKIHTEIPEHHAHLAPKSSDIRYPKMNRSRAKVIDIQSQNSGTVLSDLINQGYKVI